MSKAFPKKSLLIKEYWPHPLFFWQLRWDNECPKRSEARVIMEGSSGREINVQYPIASLILLFSTT